jgi:hypothetical protein
MIVFEGSDYFFAFFLDDFSLGLAESSESESESSELTEF